MGKTFLMAVEQNTKGDKISLTYAQESSQSKTVFDASIFPKRFYEFLYTITEEFRRLCVFGNDTNYAIAGLKVRDLDEGSSQEIQFIVNIRQDNIGFENAKTTWKELRDIPLNIFTTDTPAKRQAEAMNGIVVVFNALQDYVNEHLAQWLEMDGSDGQMSLFDRKSIEDSRDKIQNTFDRLSAAKEFSEKMKDLSNKTGTTMTVTSRGKELAVFAPDEK